MHRLEIFEAMEQHPLLVAHLVNYKQLGYNIHNEEMLGVFTDIKSVVARLQTAINKRYPTIQQDSYVRIYTVYLNSTDNDVPYEEFRIHFNDGVPVYLWKERR